MFHLGDERRRGDIGIFRRRACLPAEAQWSVNRLHHRKNRKRVKWCKHGSTRCGLAKKNQTNGQERGLAQVARHGVQPASQSNKVNGNLRTV